MVLSLREMKLLAKQPEQEVDGKGLTRADLAKEQTILEIEAQTRRVAGIGVGITCGGAQISVGLGVGVCSDGSVAIAKKFLKNKKR